MKNILIITFLLTLLSCDDATKTVFTNYNEKNKELQELAIYFESVKPQNLRLFIKFHSETKIDFRLDQKNHVDKSTWSKDDLFDHYGQFHKYDVSIEDPEIDKALKIIAWNQTTLENLKSKLDNANCDSASNKFSIDGNEYLAHNSFGYPTYDLYGLDYLIFSEQLSDENLDELLKSCSLKKINGQVLVQYGGPSFGIDCFPDKR